MIVHLLAKRLLLYIFALLFGGEGLGGFASTIGCSKRPSPKPDHTGDGALDGLTHLRSFRLPFAQRRADSAVLSRRCSEEPSRKQPAETSRDNRLIEHPAPFNLLNHTNQCVSMRGRDKACSVVQSSCRRTHEDICR